RGGPRLDLPAEDLAGMALERDVDRLADANETRVLRDFQVEDEGSVGAAAALRQEVGHALPVSRLILERQFRVPAAAPRFLIGTEYAVLGDQCVRSARGKLGVTIVATEKADHDTLPDYSHSRPALTPGSLRGSRSG